jgi:hypothetical protein
MEGTLVTQGRGRYAADLDVDPPATGAGQVNRQTLGSTRAVWRAFGRVLCLCAGGALIGRRSAAVRPKPLNAEPLSPGLSG